MTVGESEGLERFAGTHISMCDSKCQDIDLLGVEQSPPTFDTTELLVFPLLIEELWKAS